MAPRILLLASLRWPIAARLAIAFTALGCRVEAMCPRQHPVAKTRVMRKIYSYNFLNPLASLRHAIASAAPDIVIPCDDNAALNLSRLYETLCVESSDRALASLITRSLGSPAACVLATSRGALMALAAEEKVRVPSTAVISAAEELNPWFERNGFPAAIKIDCTWGGFGVAIVHDQKQARLVFERMAAAPAFGKSVARTLLDRDPVPLLNLLTSTKRTITLQKFISGVPANRAVACWQGRVLGGISVEALQTQHPTGPATVVRVIENNEMAAAAERLVRRLGLSGLWGLDFILEAHTGAAYFIEMNPRATPICHLALPGGKNLPAALYTQLTGIAPLAPSLTIADEVIAMFPGEWHRQPASSYLRTHYHDVPWEEPELIKDCLNKPWAERGLIARCWARMRPKSIRKSLQRKIQTAIKIPNVVKIIPQSMPEYPSVKTFETLKEVSGSGETTKLLG